MKPKLEPVDYEAAATTLDCSVPAIRAVAEIESAGDGFYASGLPKILFEGHIFSRYTNGVFDQSNPTISYPKWTTKHYLKGEREYERLNLAKTLNLTAALMSASWGKFQIMGFNFALCGFIDVIQFADAMGDSEHAHLMAFVAYIEHVGLADELREKRFADFARKYNGPLFRRNSYDTKLARAYAKYGGE